MRDTLWPEATTTTLLPQLVLPTEDGIPLETNWHRIEMNLLIDSVHSHWEERSDYFVGGNMFLYFSAQQVRNRDYRGPDFFLVKNVDGTRNRDSWVVWEEGGRYPNVIIELASISTINEDLGPKKSLYEQTFRTPEYFCYNPFHNRLHGWRLIGGRYQELQPNEKGWLWSEELQLWVGTWEGKVLKVNEIWLRFYEPDESKVELVPTLAEAEAQRADAAEAELIRLRELLANLGVDEEGSKE